MDALLVPLHRHGRNYVWHARQKQVLLGRHPACDIAIDDRYLSLYHVGFHTDELGRRSVEALGTSYCVVNSIPLKKGDVCDVRHGDHIRLITFDASGNVERQPFVAYMLLVWPVRFETWKTLRSGARLLRLGNPDFCKSFDCAEGGDDGGITIGRDPCCNVVVKEAWLCHLSIHERTSAPGCYVLQQLSPTGCFINEHYLADGDSWELRHGDMIILCKRLEEFRPDPVFIFYCQPIGVDILVKDNASVGCQNRRRRCRAKTFNSRLRPRPRRARR